jgi:transcription-repair coupling factor (superfamily II helicase)
VYPEELVRRSLLESQDFQSLPQVIIEPWAQSNESELSLACQTNEDLRSLIRKQDALPFEALSAQFKKWLEDNRLIIVASSHVQQRRLCDLFEPYALPLNPFEGPTPFRENGEPGRIPLYIGNLTRGFRCLEKNLIIVTDEEIFGPKSHHQEKGAAGQERFLSFGDLKEGDCVIHEDHGVGYYRGLQRLAIEHIENDFVVLEYANNDKLYVPVYRMNQIQAHTGGSGKPRLDKLGSGSWHKVRDKAQKAIRQMAGELLNLYAARRSGKGFAYPPANDLFESFEASFPYEETIDQSRAIHEVLKDMEKPVPMDRLVLGDVGYGKTEVAMRAAFRAVLSSKQVAILVPTTVLAFQHYRTFCERFKDYPVKLGIVSRFQKPSENKATIKKMSEGKIDIIIGTHRLLQSDVQFKDLGLLVIDEEHRFGVNQKEKIKQFKKSVDVLALSATPIPRTLHMSISGIRGVSVIETPPTDRLSIRTYVAPYGDAIVQEAVDREIRRGGQVFYVHNRVQDILRVQDRLVKLFPKIRIGLGHGQMKDGELEQAMISFASGDFDLLLCTTIIESGIDIPTANTIIMERADHFGLAQIYQLRGRVGRGAVRAYAYLLVPPRDVMTADAQKRLAVLRRFSELGSGFKMASHDLEIRGAGNLLGDKQSGHMNAIGYELYVELLEQAVREHRGELILNNIEPELNLRVNASIPEDYIPDPPVRLEIYRRLAALESIDESYQIEEEIADRFGKIPSETENLILLMMIKVYAKKLRMRSIHCSRDRVRYQFDVSTPLEPDVMMGLIGQKSNKYKLSPDMKLTVKESFEAERQRLKKVHLFLKSLEEHVKTSLP